MKLLKWEDIKENTKYRDQVYGTITIHAKSIIKNEKLLAITYGDTNEFDDRDKFPVNFDGMKIFEEIYKVKTLEDLGFKRDDMRCDYFMFYYGHLDENITIYIYDNNKYKEEYGKYSVCNNSGGIKPTSNQVLHKAIELKMIELGLWEEV